MVPSHLCEGSVVQVFEKSSLWGLAKVGPVVSVLTRLENISVGFTVSDTEEEF